MITWVEKKINELDSNYVGMYEFTEEWDTLVVNPSFPLLGVSQIISAPQVQALHETGSSFDITMKYSLDNGLHWSDSILLSDISNIVTKDNQCVVLEFSIVKKGTGKGWFYGFDFTNVLNYSVPPIPEFYEERKDSIRVPYYNQTSFAWALNVLQKVYKRGIVPAFIKRGSNLNWDDEDYINLWWSIIYPIAIRNTYSKEFADLLWNPTLLANFLKQRGLILGNISGLDELFYLMSYFYDETLRRGTKSVFDIDRELEDGSTIRGEFSRLIDLQDASDLFIVLINDYEQGWWLGYSSPCNYVNSDIYHNYKIGYEQGIIDIDNYPLLKPTGVDIEVNNHTIEKTQGSVTSYAGIGANSYSDNEDYLIPVSGNRNYLAKVKFHLDSSQDVKLGVVGYNGLHNVVNFKYKPQSGNIINQNVFFEGTLGAGDYCFWALIADSTATGYKESVDGYNRVLHFPDATSIVSLVPQFWSKGDFEITEFSVCTWYPIFSYIDAINKGLFEIYLKNHNDNYSEQEIKEIAIKKLLPVNSGYTFNFE